jgi:hypothetical protein
MVPISVPLLAVSPPPSFEHVHSIEVNIYRNIILPYVLYGCESWSLILRVERRPRLFDSRVLREIFGPKNDEVTGEWRKLHDLYSSSTIVRVIKLKRIGWAGYVAWMG